MAAKLFVGNLSFQATEEDLRELFAQAGNVETVRIITDQFTGRPRGFGFVEMATKEEAQKAVEMLNGRLFRDRNLVVDEARPQPQRGAGGAGPRGERQLELRSDEGRATLPPKSDAPGDPGCPSEKPPTRTGRRKGDGRARRVDASRTSGRHRETRRDARDRADGRRSRGGPGRRERGQHV